MAHMARGAHGFMQVLVRVIRPGATGGAPSGSHRDPVPCIPPVDHWNITRVCVCVRVLLCVRLCSCEGLYSPGMWTGP